MCPEWHDFLAFREWALSNGYADTLTIDRKDNDGPYAPWNCRWVTRQEQARNRRCGRDVTIRGVSKPLWRWIELTEATRDQVKSAAKRCGMEAAILEFMGRNGVDFDAAAAA